MNILEKNLLILASAGSGKTFQLGNRVIGLVARGVEPEKIVALTFTRKAAGEFADAVLTKLADAADDPEAAATLSKDLNLPAADFIDSLERVVRALPRLTFGTMDSFFSRVVRGFQYELGLTGGKFDLLEGPRAEAAADEMLGEILGEALDDESSQQFLEAFRRATIGKEAQDVLNGLREFVKRWQGIFRNRRDFEWGPAWLNGGVKVDDWSARKAELAKRVRRGLDGVDYTDKRQRQALETAIDALEKHTIGSGSLSSMNALLEGVCTAACKPSGPMQLKHYKEFLFTGPSSEALCEMVTLAAKCEMAAALTRTKAVRDVVAVYDRLCDQKLRQRGMLGFDDVKFLMGEWAKNENAFIRRQLVDFRLDAKFEHWLLDEFQDTSGADWAGLSPLIDEATGEGEGTVFIVGDRKQAIYAWRGGEVGLFDEVIGKYTGANLQTAPLTESWRSCPEVLALVNKVCGNASLLSEFFGEAATRWHWDDHTSAKPLLGAGKSGEARVEIVEGKFEERLNRLVEILGELGVGTRALSCGILVRSNSKVQEVADHLRAEGFDVIEEGQREPAKDHPVGIMISHLLKWLADPADSFAWQVVQMSPMAEVLRQKFGEFWQTAWESLLARASVAGFAAMIEELIEPCWLGWSEYGRRRAGDVIMTLAKLDAAGGTTAREAADWVERLKVSQSPGVAAVQVMTIHKSKGLGFDVVILPDISNDAVPSAQYFEVAEGPGWLTQPPPQWARELLPEMNAAEASWGADQRYEAMCMLYVALTRSKRGLYVLLEPPPQKQEYDKPSLANWLAVSLDSNGQPGVIYQAGSPDWVQQLAPLEAIPGTPPRAALAKAVPRRERTTPSALKSSEHKVAHSGSGMTFGNEVHAVFEQVGWIDEMPPKLPSSSAGELVADLLKDLKIRSVFERNNRPVELFREQPIDAMLGGKWLSGVIDRLHIHRDSFGQVGRVEVIDFKTDAVTAAADLLTRYSGQMDAYRSVMKQAYPKAEVVCLLVSTKCRAVVDA